MNVGEHCFVQYSVLEQIHTQRELLLSLSWLLYRNRCCWFWLVVWTVECGVGLFLLKFEMPGEERRGTILRSCAICGRYEPADT